MGSLAGFLVLVLAGVLLGNGFGAAQTQNNRIPFQITTGIPTGAFFPVGEAIAGVLSHPLGLNRCDRTTACGPAGLVITARTSKGTVDNVIAVNSGAAESGLAQADVVAAAVRGQGQFRRSGKASHVRVIASLFPEDVHLIVAAKSPIKGIGDLKGKRVSLGLADSSVDLTARAILAAYRVPVASLKRTRTDLAGAIRLIETGKLDAVFAVGGLPLEQVTRFLAGGKARLAPIDGRGRDRLLKTAPYFASATIAAHTYPGQGAVQTVSTSALWIVRDSVPEPLVYGLTRALFDPANHDRLAASHPSAREIGLANAASNLPAPLHPGAARFYREKK